MRCCRCSYLRSVYLKFHVFVFQRDVASRSHVQNGYKTRKEEWNDALSFDHIYHAEAIAIRPLRHFENVFDEEIWEGIGLDQLKQLPQRLGTVYCL